MALVQERQNEEQRQVNGGGQATVLAIGTANPPNFYNQADFPDFYFRVSNNEHKTELKQTFSRMCEKSMIRKRHLFLTEEKLKENPSLFEYMAPSLDVRQNMLDMEVAKLGKEAAEKAIKEWGQPKSNITHLVFATMSGVTVPGADYQLTNLLGLNNSVKRYMVYLQGCSAGGSALRLAKDLAENNRGGRVLVVCSEIIAIFFRGPSDSEVDSMLGQALFGDGAAAVIVGANPENVKERPIFQLVSATQTILPGSEDAMSLQLKEAGLTGRLSRKVPSLISENIEQVLDETFAPIGINDWNSIFWITHPGGRAILDKIETKLGLNEEKMKASRHVLSEYGNMASPSVLFILDAMRKMSLEDGKHTTGAGLDWGVLFGFGPGLTIETILLRSFPVSDY